MLNILHEKDKKKRMGMLKKFQDTLQEIINGADKLYGEYHTEYATDVNYWKSFDFYSILESWLHVKCFTPTL